MATNRRTPPSPFLNLAPGVLPAPGAIHFGESPTGLWLPAHLLPQHVAEEDEFLDEPLSLRFAYTTLGWEALIGSPATIEDVVARIRRYSVREVAGLIGRITIVLSEGKAGGDVPTRQRTVAERLLGIDGARRVLDAARERSEADGRPESLVLFHERQTLTALKLVLLEVDVATPDAGENPVAFVEALLMLNDLIDPPEGTMGPGVDGGPEAMELYVTANTLFNESPALLSDFVRAHYMYVESRQEITRPDAVDVPAALRADFARFRSPVSLEADHSFRSKPITHFARS